MTPVYSLTALFFRLGRSLSFLMFGCLFAVSTFVGAFTPEPISFGVFRFIMGVATRGSSIVASVHCKTLVIRIILLVKHETLQVGLQRISTNFPIIYNFRMLRSLPQFTPWHIYADNVMIFTPEPRVQPLCIHSD